MVNAAGAAVYQSFPCFWGLVLFKKCGLKKFGEFFATFSTWSNFEFIVILCPTVLDNKTYLSRGMFIYSKRESGSFNLLRLCVY